MSTPSCGSPMASSAMPRSDWSTGSTRSGCGPDPVSCAAAKPAAPASGHHAGNVTELRAGGQLLGAGLEVVGQIVQGVADRLLHHRVGNGQLGFDAHIDGQQRGRADGHHRELLFLLLEVITLLQHGVDLVLAGVVDSGDERARLAADHDVEATRGGRAAPVWGAPTTARYLLC